MDECPKHITVNARGDSYRLAFRGAVLSPHLSLGFLKVFARRAYVCGLGNQVILQLLQLPDEANGQKGENTNMKLQALIGVGLLMIATALIMAQDSLENQDKQFQMLFVQNAKDASVVNGKLRLKGVGPTTLFFADRPKRIAGHFVTNHLEYAYEYTLSLGHDRGSRVPVGAPHRPACGPKRRSTGREERIDRTDQL